MTLDSFSKDDINYIINEVTERVYKSLSSGDEFKTGISLPINPEESSKNVAENIPSPLQSCLQCTQDKESCSGCGECIAKKPDEIRQIISFGAARISGQLRDKIAPKDLSPYIDHTLLRANASEEEIIKLCDEAKRYGFASVCINPSYVELSAKLLKGTSVKVCTVIGFPLGATTTEAKKYETIDAIKKGANEIDMVINIGKLKSGDLKYVYDDIKSVVDAAKGKTVKVILEMAMLTDEEKVKGSYLAKSAGAHFVKTSTGFGPGGATARDVAIMRKTVGPEMGIKAAGGIKDYDTAVQMIKSGATRIGASASVSIVGSK